MGSIDVFILSNKDYWNVPVGAGLVWFAPATVRAYHYVNVVHSYSRPGQRIVIHDSWRPVEAFEYAVQIRDRHHFRRHARVYHLVEVL